MQKKRRYYTIFSTPESLEFILKYLDAQPPKEYDDDTYLFRNIRTNDYLIRNAFNEYFEKLDRRCNFPSKQGELIFFRPHNLRRWFGNQLKRTDLGYTDTRHLMDIFPTSNPRARRDSKKLMQLIKESALLFQYQRCKSKLNEKPVLVASWVDLAHAILIGWAYHRRYTHWF